MAANKIHEMDSTRGTFQVMGKVIGTEKDKFYTEKKTKTNKDFRMINFGVKYNENQTIYVSLNGMPKDKVYVSKRDKETKKTEVKDIPWKNRDDDHGDYRLIGVNVGLEKTKDDKGNTVNDKKTMVEYDACSYIAEHLNDDDSVFVKGNLEYSSYTDSNGEVKRSVKYIPTQISLCKNPVDFDAYDDTHKMTHDFEQTIVFNSIDQERDENDKATGRFIVEAKIVNYNSIENAEFIVENAKLAKTMKKAVKPFDSIKVFGHMNVSMSVDEVESEDDGWGDSNPMERINSPIVTEMVITGAEKESIDHEKYSEEEIAATIKKINASKNAEKKFDGEKKEESSDDWGSDDGGNDSDEAW